MNVCRPCDNKQPHKSHRYDLPPHPDLPGTKLTASCNGVQWPVIDPAKQCESVILSEGSPLLNDDRFFMCVREKGHRVSSEAREYHSTREHAIQWTDRFERKVDGYNIVVHVDESTYADAQRFADALAKHNPGCTVVDLVPTHLGYEVER